MTLADSDEPAALRSLLKMQPFDRHLVVVYDSKGGLRVLVATKLGKSTASKLV